MNLIQTALFKLALKEKITETELRVLNALSKKELNFLQLSEKTGLELKELKEILKEFEKKKIVQERGGKYFFDALDTIYGMVEETQTIAEMA